MAGLSDLFSGGMFGGSGADMYGDLLTPEMRQQMAWRGLMAAAGALGQAGMPSRMPVPLGAALGQAAGAMSGAQDQGLEAALKALLTRGKLQEMQGNLEIDKQIFGQAGKEPPMYAPGAMPGAPSTAAPGSSAPAAGGLSVGGVIPRKMAEALPAWINDPNTGGLRNIPGLDQTAQQGALEQFKAAIRANPTGGTAVASGAGNLGYADAKKLALDVGFKGPAADEIAAISLAESSGNPSAFNPNDPRGGSYGLTQINGVHQGAQSALGNPRAAMELAYRVSNGGQDFSPWSTYMSGKYREFLPTADTVVAGAAPQAPVAQAAYDPTGGTGRSPFPPGTKFNSRGEPYNLADAPGQQISAAQVTPERMRQLAQANASVLPAQATPGAAPATPPTEQLPAAALPQAPATLPASAPPPVTPYGGVNPAYIKWAQLQSQLLTRRKYPVPSYISEAAALPLKYAEPGANVGLQEQLARTKTRAEEETRDPWLRGRATHAADEEIRKAWSTPTDLQKGLVAMGIDPASPQGREITLRAFPDTRPEAVKAADAAGLQGVDRSAALAGAIPGNAPTSDQKNYQSYFRDETARGNVPLSEYEWGINQGRAKAQSIAINTAEGREAALLKARIAIDTKAAENVGEQALLARRLMPVVDELGRIADKTPEGYAGPMAAATAKTFSALGLPVSEGMSNAEAMVALSQRLIPLVREPGATAASEMEAYLRATPGLRNSADGRKKIAEITKSLMQRTIDISKVYRENVGAPDLFEKLATLDKPILTDEQREAVERANASNPAGPAPAAGGVRERRWNPTTGQLE